jgi:hypothetical protein
MDRLSQGQVYLGAPIEHASERTLLKRLLLQLSSSGPYVLLANFHVRGRQIDFAIATPSGAAILEAKSTVFPIHGSINGDWSRSDLAGKLLTYANPYEQALSARYALRDEMAQFKDINTYYPGAFVVFVGGIPQGSSVPNGDFKVRILADSEWTPQLVEQNGAPWELSDWKAFASELGLKETSAEHALATEAHRRDEALIEKVRAAIVAELDEDASSWLADTPEAKEQLATVANETPGMYLWGPSGCGKSLCARWLTVELNQRGSIALYLSAKDFPGTWSRFLRQELSLLSEVPPESFLSTIRRHGCRTFVIVDGLNEFGENGRRALRSIRALARWLGARIVLTGQDRDALGPAGVTLIPVEPPSLQLKKRIAERSGRNLSKSGLGLLEAVKSGFEAHMVGKADHAFNEPPTRIELVDCFVRTLLRNDARAGSLTLRRLATTLHAELRFSIQETAFDDLLVTMAVPFTAADHLFEVGLLVRRRGRVSFSHEIIQNSFAAIDLAKLASSDPRSAAKLLLKPLTHALANDTVAAIDDSFACLAVLQMQKDPKLLATAANGSLGPIAAASAQQLLDEAHRRCLEEIRGLRLTILDEGGLTWDSESQYEWLPEELARIGAIGLLAATGMTVEPYFELCDEVDKQLVIERRRLFELARAKNVGTNSRSFELAYLGFTGAIGFTSAATNARDWRWDPSQHRDAAPRLVALSYGRLYFYLENYRHYFEEAAREGLAVDLEELLLTRFKSLPYHLQMSMLHVVTYAMFESEDSRQRLAAAIQTLDTSNWAINSFIFEALASLGALDSEAEATRDQVKEDILTALSATTLGGEAALRICVAIIDHPFDFIYMEEVDSLSAEQQNLLYRRAVSAIQGSASITETWLLGRVAALGDRDDCALFTRFATFPDAEGVMPQEDWGRFLLSVRFLGRHGVALPNVEPTTPEGRCVNAIRAIIHRAEASPDLRWDIGWSALLNYPAKVAVGCLGQFQRALSESYQSEAAKSFPAVQFFKLNPAFCLQLARQFVDSGEDAIYFGRCFDQLGPQFAFDAIGQLGDRSDLHRLRTASQNDKVAWLAARAIKSIDLRP